jgi:hypothetical protein
VRYVEFVQLVYGGIASAILGGDSFARNIGVDPRKVHASLDCDAPDDGRAIVEAVMDLIKLGMLDGDQWHVSLGPTGRQVGIRPLSDLLWPSLFEQVRVEDGDREFVAKAVELSEDRFERCAAMRHVHGAAVMEALGRAADPLDMVGIFKRLHERVPELVMGIAALDGTVELRVRYAGVVLATERAQTELVQLVRGLLPEWETVTVEVKREVHLETKAQKAEFIKDIAAMATTKASGSRYLVLGWDPTTRLFTTSVDPGLTLDRMEQILAAYLDPVPGITYRTFGLEGGTAALIEVIRRSWEVPYRVKTAIHRLAVKDVFVRHGSQVEKPSPAELDALIEEGERARNERDES